MSIPSCVWVSWCGTSSQSYTGTLQTVVFKLWMVAKNGTFVLRHAGTTAAPCWKAALRMQPMLLRLTGTSWPTLLQLSRVSFLGASASWRPICGLARLGGSTCFSGRIRSTRRSTDDDWWWRWSWGCKWGQWSTGICGGSFGNLMWGFPRFFLGGENSSSLKEPYDL